MRILNIAFAFLLATTAAFAQPTNKQAKQLLTDASAKLKSYNTIFIGFDYSFVNEKANVNQNEKGTIGIKGDDYHFNFMGMEQIRKGTKLYTILTEDEEVQITEFSEDDDQGLTPSSILNLYQEGYSYKMAGSSNIDGKKVQQVKLKPIASEEIKEIEVGVEKDTKKIVYIKQTGTNGTVTTFNITTFEPNKKFPANYFTFNKSDYPGYYIAD